MASRLSRDGLATVARHPLALNGCRGNAQHPRQERGRSGDAAGASNRRGSMVTASLTSNQQAACPTGHAPSLSVVIPTRNEAGNVQRLFTELERALAGIEHEVIVVDDSSDEVTRR